MVSVCAPVQLLTSPVRLRLRRQGEVIANHLIRNPRVPEMAHITPFSQSEVGGVAAPKPQPGRERLQSGLKEGKKRRLKVDDFPLA